MRNVTVAAVQMKCSKSVEKNIAHAEELVLIVITADAASLGTKP